MRTSELAARSGVAVSAIKYYQREKLLPDGKRSNANQVAYGEPHLRRVLLVRALIEVGGLSDASVKQVIAAIDDSASPLSSTFAVAQHAMSAVRTSESEPSEESQATVRQAASSQGWQFSDDNPGVVAAARAIDGLRAIEFDPSESYLKTYIDAAFAVAVADLKVLSTRSGRDATAELMVVGTVLGDPLFAGFRRLAHEDATASIWATAEQR